MISTAYVLENVFVRLTHSLKFSGAHVASFGSSYSWTIQTQHLTFCLWYGTLCPPNSCDIRSGWLELCMISQNSSKSWGCLFILAWLKKKNWIILSSIHIPHLWNLQHAFLGPAYQGKDIVFRFIIGYSSLRDFGPLVIGLFLYEDSWKMIFWFVLKLEIRL